MLQGIEVPNELGLEVIDRRKVLEKALPDASTVVTNKVDTSLPSTRQHNKEILEKQNELLKEEQEEQQKLAKHIQATVQTN